MTIERLWELNERATAAPWNSDGPIVVGNGTTIDVDGCSIAHVFSRFAQARFSRDISGPTAEANADLIVELRNALPWIIDSLNNLYGPRVEREDVEAACNCAKDSNGTLRCPVHRSAK